MEQRAIVLNNFGKSNDLRSMFYEIENVISKYHIRIKKNNDLKTQHKNIISSGSCCLTGSKGNKFSDKLQSVETMNSRKSPNL